MVRKITAMHQKVKSERKGVIATYRQMSFNMRFHPMWLSFGTQLSH